MYSMINSLRLVCAIKFRDFLENFVQNDEVLGREINARTLTRSQSRFHGFDGNLILCHRTMRMLTSPLFTTNSPRPFSHISSPSGEIPIARAVSTTFPARIMLTSFPKVTHLRQ